MEFPKSGKWIKKKNDCLCTEKYGEKKLTLIEAASNISAIGYEDTDDVDSTLRQAEDVLFQVRSGQSERGFIALRQIYDQYMEERAALAEPMAQGGAPVMRKSS